jgi:hypothetical protein
MTSIRVVLLVVIAWHMFAADSVSDVLKLDREIETAVLRADVGFLDKICDPDFSYTHGDGWTTGGAPLLVDNRATWLASVGKATWRKREVDLVKVEMHGDVAITYGRIRAQHVPPEQREITIWWERVYAKRDGRWQFLSHRTVNGPVYSQPSGEQVK